jgi:hypothetical protein
LLAGYFQETHASIHYPSKETAHRHTLVCMLVNTSVCAGGLYSSDTWSRAFHRTWLLESYPAQSKATRTLWFAISGHVAAYLPAESQHSSSSSSSSSNLAELDTRSCTATTGWATSHTKIPQSCRQTLLHHITAAHCQSACCWQAWKCVSGLWH